MEESDQSNINPLALVFLVAMCIVILCASPKKAIWAILATAAFIPLGQQIVLAGLHLHFLRILILAGIVRLISRRETAGFKLARVDKLVISCLLVGFVCGLIRDFTAETFGGLYNDLGAYLLVRVLMRDAEDPGGDFKMLVWISIGIGACMLCENFTHKNPLYVLGGVPENTIIRDGRFRCQGPFRHPILAGTFGATLFPLVLVLWQRARTFGDRGLAIAGAVAAVVITLTSASSGPLMTLVAIMVGYGLWPLRHRMYLFRRSVVVVLIGLALVMKAPVWFLIAKISDLTGGGGFYRSDLIDKFVKNFTQWCFIGTSYTANWAAGGVVLAINPNMVDITNNYVAQGVAGGILKLGLFVAGLVACFKICGSIARDDDQPIQERRLAWALGVCLAGHCTAFISIAYFDQIQVFWFWLLATIAHLPEREAQTAERDGQSAFGPGFDETAAAPGAN
jgi:hypothetical protein